MGYLQLAEGDEFTSLAETVIQNRDKYIFIPAGYRGASKDLYVREDFFDGMPEADFDLMMYELSNYQNTGLSAKADRKARRDARAAKKATKGGGARREARQKRVDARMKAKVDKAGAKGSGKGGAFLDKVGGIVGNIMGGKDQLEVTAGGGEFSVDTDAQEESWISRNKIPLAIGGIVLIGGGIYLATRKKKK